MSVSGNINNEAYAMAMLDGAKQSLKNHHARIKLEKFGGMIMPHHDNPLSGTNLEKAIYDARGVIANRTENGQEK